MNKPGKPPIILPQLPRREVTVETSDQILRPPEKPRIQPTPPAQEKVTLQIKPEKKPQSTAPVAKDERENTTRFSTWLYPSQIEKLQAAAKDYEKRHPKRRPSVGIAALVRIAVDLVPKGGEELDRFIEKGMN